jgi:hypothetical protein
MECEVNWGTEESLAVAGSGAAGENLEVRFPLKRFGVYKKTQNPEKNTRRGNITQQADARLSHHPHAAYESTSRNPCAEARCMTRPAV